MSYPKDADTIMRGHRSGLWNAEGTQFYGSTLHFGDREDLEASLDPEKAVEVDKSDVDEKLMPMERILRLESDSRWMQFGLMLSWLVMVSAHLIKLAFGAH